MAFLFCASTTTFVGYKVLRRLCAAFGDGTICLPYEYFQDFDRPLVERKTEFVPSSKSSLLESGAGSHVSDTKTLQSQRESNVKPRM